LYPYFFSVPEEAGIVGRLSQNLPDALYAQSRSSPQSSSRART